MLVLLLVPAVIIVAGLVVDGGRKVAAAQHAEAAASAAARAGQNASASGQLAGRADTTAAVLAARRLLARTPEVEGTVRLLPGGRLEVTTRSDTETLYLGLIGIDRLTGRGEAVAALVDSRAG